MPLHVSLPFPRHNSRESREKTGSVVSQCERAGSLEGGECLFSFCYPKVPQLQNYRAFLCLKCFPRMPEAKNTYSNPKRISEAKPARSQKLSVRQRSYREYGEQHHFQQRYTPRNQPLTFYPVHTQSRTRAITQPELDYTSRAPSWRCVAVSLHITKSHVPAREGRPVRFLQQIALVLLPRQPAQPTANSSPRSFIRAGRMIHTNSTSRALPGRKRLGRHSVTSLPLLIPS